METTAKLRGVRLSAQKGRLVADGPRDAVLARLRGSGPRPAGAPAAGAEKFDASF